jgi:hypothetical protein
VEYIVRRMRKHSFDDVIVNDDLIPIDFIKTKNVLDNKSFISLVNWPFKKTKISESFRHRKSRYLLLLFFFRLIKITQETNHRYSVFRYTIEYYVLGTKSKWREIFDWIFDFFISIRSKLIIQPMNNIINYSNNFVSKIKKLIHKDQIYL